ncbi:MAG: DNA helicase RecQ [Sphingobacteriales bacterium]|nr:MAG: DNA helicase RecQ [Sphingobacteriales bacterium]
MYGQKNIHRALKHYFGYDEFRLNQQQIIESVLNGNDVLAIMPTGGGKSICYQLPALLHDGLTIVISPLIALMKDQVDGLLANGIDAAYLNSTVGVHEQQQILSDAKSGKLKLLYIAPERLFSNDQQMVRMLSNFRVALFAIDEAHCISQWGHDFRPEYLQLSALKRHFPDVPTIALTASADGITQKDIAEKLALRSPRIYLSSFNRANISYYVQPKKNALNQLVQYIGQHKNDSGIIYTLSRSSTETLAAKLRDLGFPAAHYHAGMVTDERNRVQESFKRDDTRIIVATIAFGMGIDKPNVRFVMHYDVPKNMEGYYQETGRAGRDGLHSDAILYYSSGDIMKLMGFVELENNPQQSSVLKKKLYQMKEFAEREGCRRQYILNYFGENAPSQCGSCDFCLSDLEHQNATLEAQKALSAIARTGERFGMDYLIDFLRGSQSMKIHAPHKELKTFGIGKDRSKEEWQQIFRQLLQQGLTEQAEGQYPVLRLNDKSWSVLKGEHEVQFVRKKAKAALVADDTPQHYPELLQELKDIRRDIAEREHVPAYAVVGDNSLQEMAAYLPLSFDELKQISGFGDYKVAKYGPPFLDTVRRYASTYGLQSRMAAKAPKKVSRERKETTGSGKPSSNASQRASLQMFRDGLSVYEIAEQRGFSATTIEGHLATFIASGELPVTEVVSGYRLEKILEAIQQLGGSHALKPVKDILPDDYTYGEIKAALAHLQYQNG